MILINKNQRDLLGIDTLERAIAFSTLLIRKGLKEGELPTNSVIIYQSFTNTPEGRNPNITVEFKIPYSQSTFLSKGGDFLSSILPFTNEEITYTGDPLTPSLSELETEPNYVNTLEQYLVWASSEWIKLNKINNPDTWEISGYLSFLEEASPAVISAKVVLPYDYQKYLETKNLLESLISFNNSNQTSSLIGTDLFGNLFLVGN